MCQMRKMRLDLVSNCVHGRVVVAVFRRVETHLPYGLVADEIVVERTKKLVHRKCLFVEDERANRCERIDDRTETHDVEETEIERLFDAYVDQYGD